MSDPRPLCAISAAPLEAAGFPRFFEVGGVRGLLEHPGGLRDAGFDMETGDQVRIVRGEFLEVGYPHWKRLQLYEDGTLIARVPADEEFLSWAAAKNAESFWGHPRLNPLALIEFVYTFTDLYSRLLQLLQPTPTRVRLRTEFRHLFKGEARLYMTPHALETGAWMFERVKHFAPEAQMQMEIDVDSDTLKESPPRVAYLLVERIYAWFGATPEEIPYVSRGEDSVPVVDVATIKAGGRK